MWSTGDAGACRADRRSRGSLRPARPGCLRAGGRGVPTGWPGCQRLAGRERLGIGVPPALARIRPGRVGGKSRAPGGLARGVRGALGLAADGADAPARPGAASGDCRDRAPNGLGTLRHQGEHQPQQWAAPLPHARRPGLRSHADQFVARRTVVLLGSRGTLGGLAAREPLDAQRVRCAKRRQPLKVGGEARRSGPTEVVVRRRCPRQLDLPTTEVRGGSEQRRTGQRHAKRRQRSADHGPVEPNRRAAQNVAEEGRVIPG